MAVLTWKDVDFNPVPLGQGPGASVNIFNESLGGLRSGLQALEARQMRDTGTKGIADALKYVDPAAYAAAAEAGRLQMAPGTEDWFSGRHKELLANEQTGVQTTGFRYDNEGKLIDNRQAEETLRQDVIDFEDAELLEVNAVKAAPLLAQIAQLGNQNTSAARAQAEELIAANAETLAAAGYDVSTGMDGILTRMGNERTRFEAQHKLDTALGLEQAREVARPLVDEIIAASHEGTRAGFERAQQLMKQYGPQLTAAQIDIDTLLADLPTNFDTGAGVNPAITEAEAAEKGIADKLASDARFNQIETNQPYINEAEALEAIDKMDDLSFEARELLKGRVSAATATLYKQPDIRAAQEEYERGSAPVSPSNMPAPTPTSFEELQAIGEQASQTGSSPSASQTAALVNLGRTLDTGASEAAQIANTDAAFGGYGAAVARALQQPAEGDIGDYTTQANQAFADIAPKELDPAAEESWSASQAQFRDEVDRIVEHWGVRPDVAIALAKGATSQAGFWKIHEGHYEVNQKKVDEYVRSVVGGEGLTDAQRVTKALSYTRQENIKAVGAETLARSQAEYRSAVTDFYSARSRGEMAVANRAWARAVDIGKRYQSELDAFRNNPAVTANLRANTGHR